MIRENCFKINKFLKPMNAPAVLKWLFSMLRTLSVFQWFPYPCWVRASLGSLMEMLLFYSLLPMYWNLPWKLGWVLYFTVVTWILELSREQVIYLFNCSRTLNIVIILILPLGTQFSQFLDEAEEEGKYNVGERICWFCVYVSTSLLFLFTYMNFLSSWLFLFKFLGS